MKMESAMMLGTEQEFSNHTHHRKLKDKKTLKFSTLHKSECLLE
jgi:hypothetical protein